MLNPKPPLAWALPGLVLAYGAGTLVSQVLLLQELLVLVQGQELKLALGLWCWLILTGLGALLGGRLATRRPAAPAHLGGLLYVLGWLLPATLLAARALPRLAGLPLGQTLPVGLTFVLFLALLTPFALVSGCFFPFACQVLAAAAPEAAIGRVYYLETLGAALGILPLQFLFLGRVPHLALGLGTGLILTLAALKWGGPRTFPLRPLAFLGLLALGALLFLSPGLEGLSRRWQWPGRQVVAAVDSPYGLLTATREEGQFSFFANNLWHFTYPDPYNAEHAVQLGLLQHPQPRRVLLLGGGVAGLVPEILKTRSVTHLDYVELDPHLVRLAQQVLPAAALPGAETAENPEPKPGTPRVRLLYQDARRYLTQTREHYDVILLNLPEPQNAQLNRYYTLEFFRIVAAHLEPQGVFSFSLTGAGASLNPWRAAYLALAYNTLRQALPEVLVFPGERTRFFATAAPGVLLANPRDLLARRAARQLKLKYIQDYYLLHDLSLDRQAYLSQVLSQQPPELNLDLNPRCYFYDLLFSGVQEGLPLKEALLALKGLPGFIPWTALALFSLATVALLPRRPGARYLYQVLVMGLGTMGLEILILILFQIHLGYLYRQLGLLIAAFMLGMALGSAWGARQRAGAGTEGRLLAALQAGLAALALALALVLPLLSESPWLPREGLTQAGLALVLGLAGFGGGGIFALSSALWVKAQPGAAAKGGVLYAVDLLGATLGILGLSLLVLPVWGLLPALYLLAALHTGAALVGLRGEKS
jgi:spermidine synthase